MGQQQQIIYVEGKGFIPIQSGQTVQQAIALAQPTQSGAEWDTGPAREGTSLSIKGPMDGQSVGFGLPPVPKEGAEQILDAFPQIAGLIAQFTPLGKGYKGAAGVPAVIDAIMQALESGGDLTKINPLEIGMHAAGGVVGKGAGDVIGGVGRMGEEKILRSLNLSGKLKNESAEEMLPKLAMREKAQITKPGVQAIRDKAAATGSGGLEELGEAMGKSRLDAATAKTKTTFWPNELLSNFLNQPARQMAAGQAMAQPFGVNTAETLAPGGEAGVRALLAYIASQLGGGAQPPVEAPSGPQRRIRE